MNPVHFTLWQRCKRKLSREPQFLVEVVGLIVLALYTSAQLYQSCQVARSTDAAVDTVRAWMIPVDVDPPAPDQIDAARKFPIEFQNGGKTPASDLRLTEEFKFRDRSGKQTMPQFDGCPNTVPYAYGAVNAGDSRWFDPPAVNLNLTPDQVAQLAAHSGALLVHACLRYKTVFGSNEGMTEYCTVAYANDLKATAPCLPTSLELR